MSEPKKRKKPWLRRLLIAFLGIIVILAGIYWYVATDKFADTSERKPAFTLSALDFMHEFQQNLQAANTKYEDKILVINGRVAAIEPADTTVNVKFVDPATGNYVIFAFQQQHLSEAKTVKEGDSVSIKGSCSGGIYSEILDVTSISFKRSALNK